MNSVAPSGEQKIKRQNSNRIQPARAEGAEGKEAGVAENKVSAEGAAAGGGKEGAIASSGGTRVASLAGAPVGSEKVETIPSTGGMAEDASGSAPPPAESAGAEHTLGAAVAAGREKASASSTGIRSSGRQHTKQGDNSTDMSEIGHLGIDLEFLEGFVEAEGIAEATLTRSLTSTSLCRAAEIEGVSPAEYLLRDKNNAGYVGKATHYVIHAWKMPFMHLVQTLSDFVRKRGDGAEKCYFYTDLLCDKVNPKKNLTKREVRERANGIKKTIQSIGASVLVLTPYQAVTLRDTRCLIDIYYTLDAECVLEICLMMSSDGINFPIGSLRTALKNASISSSELSSRMDAQCLNEVLENCPVSHRRLSSRVRARLREWLVNRAEAVVTKLKEKEGLSSEVTLKAINNYGDLLTDFGDDRKACAMLRLCWETRRDLLGNNTIKTVLAGLDYADALKNSGEYLHEALAIYKDACMLCRQRFGDEDSQTLRAEWGYAMLLLQENRNDETAEKMYHHVLDHRKQVWGKTHAYTLQAEFDRAVFVHKCQKLEEADYCYQYLLPKMEQVHGKEHPMTVEAKILASRLLPKEDASELLKELLQSVEYGVGLNHRCTIDIKLEIAKVLDEQIKAHMVVLEKYEKIHGRSGKLLRREGKENALMLFAEGEADPAESFSPYAQEILTVNSLGGVGSVRGGAQATATAAAAAALPQAATWRMGPKRYINAADTVKNYEEVVEWRRQKYGPADPRTCDVEWRLAFLYTSFAPDHALVMYRELEKRGTYAGDELARLLLQSNIARVLRQQGNLDEALRVYGTVSERYKAILGEKHTDTLWIGLTMAATMLERANASGASSNEVWTHMDEAWDLLLGLLEKHKDVYADWHTETVKVKETMFEVLLASCKAAKVGSAARKRTRERLELLLDEVDPLLAHEATEDRSVAQEMFERITSRFRAAAAFGELQVAGEEDPEMLRLQMKSRLLEYAVERRIRIGPHRPSIIYRMAVDGPLRRLLDSYDILLRGYGDYLNTTTSKLGDGSSIQSLGMSSPKHNKGNKNNGKGGKGASGNDRGRSVQGTPRDSQGLASRPRPGSPSLDTTSVASSATVARAQNDSTGTAHGNPKGVMADDATDSSAGTLRNRAWRDIEQDWEDQGSASTSLNLSNIEVHYHELYMKALFDLTQILATDSVCSKDKELMASTVAKLRLLIKWSAAKKGLAHLQTFKSVLDFTYCLHWQGRDEELRQFVPDMASRYTTQLGADHEYATILQNSWSHIQKSNEVAQQEEASGEEPAGVMKCFACFSAAAAGADVEDQLETD